jgi:hypothetical protein
VPVQVRRLERLGDDREVLGRRGQVVGPVERDPGFLFERVQAPGQARVLRFVVARDKSDVPAEPQARQALEAVLVDDAAA